MSSLNIAFRLTLSLPLALPQQAHIGCSRHSSGARRRAPQAAPSWARSGGHRRPRGAAGGSGGGREVCVGGGGTRGPNPVLSASSTSSSSSPSPTTAATAGAAPAAGATAAGVAGTEQLTTARVSTLKGTPPVAGASTSHLRRAAGGGDDSARDRSRAGSPLPSPAGARTSTFPAGHTSVALSLPPFRAPTVSCIPADNDLYVSFAKAACSSLKCLSTASGASGTAAADGGASLLPAATTPRPSPPPLRRPRHGEAAPPPRCPTPTPSSPASLSTARHPRVGDLPASASDHCTSADAMTRSRT